jgi:hypothetical protein
MARSFAHERQLSLPLLRACSSRNLNAEMRVGKFDPMTSLPNEIDPSVAPSGAGCVECLAGASPGWWLHLRRCATCGHIGCCDNSPSQHATAHNAATGHPVLQSFEPGEDWFYDYRTGEFFNGPALDPPDSHPADQPVPGPAGAVPSDWERHLN